MAQSSVTLYGIADAALTIGKGSVADKTQLNNSGLASSRFGVRGREDLGGGLFAAFTLEMGINNDDGQGQSTSTNNQASGTPAAAAALGQQGLTFNRRSIVSVGGGFGEVTLGRDYTPHFWNHTVYDAFGTNGVGTSQVLVSRLGGPTSVRASNSIGYATPNLSGFSGQVQYYMGENASNSLNAPVAPAGPAVNNKKDGSGASLRAVYANGPISAAIAFGKTNYAAVAPSTAGNIATTNVGASYDFGVAKLSGLYDQDKVTGGLTGKGFNIGVNAPIGAGEIRAAVSSYKTNAVGTPKSSKFALGYVYNMSKRTALYGTAARVSNKGGASAALGGSTTAVNGSSTGLDLGVRHSF